MGTCFTGEENFNEAALSPVSWIDRKLHVLSQLGEFEAVFPSPSAAISSESIGMSVQEKLFEFSATVHWNLEQSSSVVTLGPKHLSIFSVSGRRLSGDYS